MALFSGLSEKLNHIFSKLTKHGRLTELEIKTAMREVRIALLEADVNISVVKQFVARVSERAVGQEILKSLSPTQQVIKIVNEELIDLSGFIKLNEELGVITSCGLEIKEYDEETLTSIVKTLRRKGFNSITIRNKELSEEEYLKIVNFFSENEMLTISMYGVGLPRQHVPTTALDVDFKSSLAVIGNAVSVSCDKKDGIFTNRTISKCPNFEKRLVLFSNIGRRER